jgi:hypothetical protein
VVGRRARADVRPKHVAAIANQVLLAAPPFSVAAYSLGVHSCFYFDIIIQVRGTRIAVSTIRLQLVDSTRDPVSAAWFLLLHNTILVLFASFLVAFLGKASLQKDCSCRIEKDILDILTCFG